MRKVLLKLTIEVSIKREKSDVSISKLNLDKE